MGKVSRSSYKNINQQWNQPGYDDRNNGYVIELITTWSREVIQL